MTESTKRYRREQELMLSAIHSLGMRTARDHLGAPQQQIRPGPTSWLGQQRNKVGLSAYQDSSVLTVDRYSTAKHCADKITFLCYPSLFYHFVFIGGSSGTSDTISIFNHRISSHYVVFHASG